MTRRRLWILPITLSLALLSYLVACELTLPSGNVCYDEHIVPLVKRDCAACHENGEYGVKLVGHPSDYPELARYMLPSAGEQSPLVTWADGYKLHPVIWSRQSAERMTMVAWINEGGGAECFDRERYGECRTEEDCEEVACICPDGTVAVARTCDVNEENGRGTCATAEGCDNPAFGLCAGTTPDPDSGPGGPDGGPPLDSGPVSPDTQPAEISFAKQITPLNRADCARCHSMGQWNVKIAGTVADYPEVMRYVDKSNPEGTNGYLYWAAGGGRHPILWPTGGTKYQLFLNWVLQGAKNN